MKHTPLPWKVGTSDIMNGTTDIRGTSITNPKTKNTFKPLIAKVSSTLYNFEEREANAEFIVRACNSHYELLECCKGLIGILTPKQYSKQFPNIYKKALEAIQKAEGNHENT